MSQKLSVFFASVYFAWHPQTTPLPSLNTPVYPTPVPKIAVSRVDVCYRDLCAPADSRLGKYFEQRGENNHEEPSLTPTPTPIKKESPTPSPSLQPTPQQTSPTPLPPEKDKEVTPPMTSPPNTPAPTASSLSDLTEAVNHYRSSLGKGALNECDDLCALAQERAKEAQNSFSHDGFQARITDGRLAGLGYVGIAENLWQGNPVSTERIVSSWRESEGHRKNMEGDWTHGCGAIEGNSAAFIFYR